MRIFERIRTKLGFPPVEPRNDFLEARDDADAAAAEPYLVPAAESMCCGHCSGNISAHIPELPTAR